MINDTIITIKYFAQHLPKEHPDMGFQTKEEAEAFIKGYAWGCGHNGKDKPCRGALAEWEIIETI